MCGLAEGVAKAIGTLAVKKVLGTTTNITYHNYIPECTPINEYIKWVDYEGNVIVHAYKCKLENHMHECFTIIYIEGLTSGEGVTFCYYLPEGLKDRLKRRFLGECPDTALKLELGSPKANS